MSFFPNETQIIPVSEFREGRMGGIVFASFFYTNTVCSSLDFMQSQHCLAMPVRTIEHFFLIIYIYTYIYISNIPL